jgi:hypothetical protein
MMSLPFCRRRGGIIAGGGWLGDSNAYFFSLHYFSDGEEAKTNGEKK